MKLNKLRLLGFKSFVEPTDFQIEHGLTGVVGPNGCGKSNLVEALRWVMGETSHKSLRAAGMDDVIFNGTNNRPARNTAEVMLFLDNADRSAPAQFNEHETLEVARRIEREKGSLYRLNGREVRARDVQLLFADASTGARSPALVHQGRIGEIIQAKPEQRDRVQARVSERIVELDRRLAQLVEDIAREQRQQADAEAALGRLATEEAGLAQDGTGMAEREADVAARVSAAETALGAIEKTFGELTGALADLVARRNQLERAVSEHSVRLMRLEAQIGEVENELAHLDDPANGAPDVMALAATAEAAQAAVDQAEAAALRAEAAHSGARQALDVARGPLGEADRRVHRLEAEAKALAKLIDVEAKKLWPPAIDLLTVDKGYEAALGAALGDDLEAPIDPASPIRWAGATADADPALPEGAERLAAHVQAPPELARRLAQLGVVDRALGAALVAQLKPGQRLVSAEGDLWRWDGFAAASNAPTAAARRLAAKNRLADLDSEITHARTDAEGKRRVLDAAEAELATAVAAEGEARHARREAQAQADAARDAHAAAEREASRLTARQSALAEAKVRLTSSRDETIAAKRDAVQATRQLGPAADPEH